MRRRGLLLAIAAAPRGGAPPARAAASDYDEELAKLDREAATAEPDRLLYLLYTRASLTADFGDFARAEEAIERAVGSGEPAAGPSDELRLYRASLNLKLHRLGAAEDDLGRLTRLAGHPYVRLLAADIALQEGRYEEAGRTYREVAAEERSWDHLARLAYFEWKTGHPDRADALYAEAQGELSAKEMRSYAWIEVQRGLIDLDRRRYGDALAHYRRAGRAYSGYWMVEEHEAEALDLLGRTEEAVAIYRRVIARTANPEYMSALANIVARRDPAAAEALYGQADARFAERFARYPEAALGHYVQHLLKRERPGPELLELAERNHQLRPNAESKLLLARACLKTGDLPRARALVAEAAATPWRSPDLKALEKQLAVRAGRRARRAATATAGSARRGR